MSVIEQIVPDGYKQTEVGVIPEDWEVDTIGSLLSITTGNKNTQDRVNDGLYPFFVRSQTVERINSFSFDGEGILTAGDGVGTGKIFHYMKGKFDFHQRVYLMYNFGEKLYGYYFYIYFSNHFYDRIMSMTAKSSVDSVRREMIADMKVSLPPYKEQTAIANTLSDVDALLTELEKLIAKKQAIKTATMQQLLTGKTRLPQFATYMEGEKQGKSKGTKLSKLGEIPEDWNVTDINEVTVSHKQGFYTKDSYTSDGTRLVRITDLNNPDVDFNSMPRLKLSERDYKQYKVQLGDVLIARSGAIGRYGIVKEKVRAVFASYIIRFNFDQSKLINDYFGYVYQSESTQEQLLSITQGSSNININAGNIKSLKIRLPKIEEQTAIATILSDMDNEIQTLEQRLAKTRQIKQGMMQELLTGRTRLPFDKVKEVD